jgi:hypothetical protein
MGGSQSRPGLSQNTGKDREMTPKSYVDHFPPAGFRTVPPKSYVDHFHPLHTANKFKSYTDHYPPTTWKPT